MMAEQHQTIRISAVAWQEGDTWIAQGIEYDIVAHAPDVQSIVKAFVRAVAENACISVHLGRKPLDGIKPAPARFQGMYDQAETALRLVRSPPMGTADLPVSLVDIRVAAHAN